MNYDRMQLTCTVVYKIEMTLEITNSTNINVHKHPFMNKRNDSNLIM